MRIDVLTLFPEACEPFFAASILGRSQAAGYVTVRCHNIRDYTSDPHAKVDDRPFGGGPGMVMMCQPVFDAVESFRRTGEGEPTVVLLTPQGRRFDQAMAQVLSRLPWLILVAGHYEGFDERIRLGLSPLEVSIGDYVLSGGESAAMVLVDAVVRLVPGVLGDDDSVREESFTRLAASPMENEEAASPGDGAVFLEYPQYTRPRVFRGMEVPEVLVSGDHGKIKAWRGKQSQRRTAERRPDLLPDGCVRFEGGRRHTAADGTETSDAESID